MDDQELQELQDADSWDDQHDEILPPARSPRVIVSVAFPREDFARVAEWARRHGMKTAEFIRKATLDHVAQPEGAPPIVVDTDGDVSRQDRSAATVRGTKTGEEASAGSDLVTS